MSPDPFAFFGLAPVFGLDMDTLQRAYLAVQQQHHPDRLPPSADAAERSRAIQHSMDANEAYQALKSPLSRAQALLRRQGIRVGGESDSHKPGHALLSEVMEWREALEEADVAALARQIEMLQSLAAETERRLQVELDAQAWLPAADATLRLQYLDKTLSDAKSKRRHLAQRP